MLRDLKGLDSDDSESSKANMTAKKISGQTEL